MNEKMQGIMKKVGPAVMVVGVLFLLGGMLLKEEKPQKGAENVQIEGLETPAEEAERLAKLAPIKILFIGNSYTLFNKMPEMLTELSRADKAASFKLEIQVYAQGGANLTGQWNKGEAAQLITSQKWDYVVLQDHSFWAMDPVNRENTYKAVAKFDELIKANGSKTVLFQTWPRKAGSRWYKDRKLALALRNPKYMMQMFRDGTNELATHIGATVIPIGDYWMYAINQRPNLELYGKDGSHPNPAGSFYTAMLFYRFFTGKLPEENPYNAKQIKPELANNLKKLASVK